MRCLVCSTGCPKDGKSGKSERCSIAIEKFFGHRKHSNTIGVFLPDFRTLPTSGLKNYIGMILPDLRSFRLPELMNNEQNDEVSDTTGDAMKNKSW